MLFAYVLKILKEVTHRSLQLLDKLESNQVSLHTRT